LRLYSTRFARWLSPGAAAPGGAGGRRGHRSYTEEDVALLARIKDLFARGRTVAEVEAALGPPPGGPIPPAFTPPSARAAESNRTRVAPPQAPRPPEAAAATRREEAASSAAASPEASGETAEGRDQRRVPPAPTADGVEATQQVVALALRALAEAQQSEEVWRRLMERRKREAEWLRAEVLRQEVELARLVVRLNERMRVVLRRVEQLADPVRAVLEARAVESTAQQRRR
jgi:DNA-binding transcriptional MerR regulator